MSHISFCPICGGSVEGDSTYCPCCGANLNDNSKQNAEPQDWQNHSDFSAYENQSMDYDYGDYDYDDPGSMNCMHGNPGQPYMNMNMNMNLYPNMQNDTGGGCAIAGLVLGILSVILCCLMWLGILIGGMGFVLSCVGLRSYRYKGAAVAGLVCSVCGILMALVELLIFF